MIGKLIFAALCSLLMIGQCHSRVISMYDLKPAEIIEYHHDIQKSRIAADVPIFKNCSQKTDKFQLTNVIVAGCTAPPCILKKGTNAQVEINFVAKEVTPAITAKVYGEFGPTKVPFPLTQPDACQCGVACPTVNKKAYVYKYSLPVLSWYPTDTLVVLWYLEDKESNEGLCMSVLVQIQA